MLLLPLPLPGSIQYNMHKLYIILMSNEEMTAVERKKMPFLYKNLYLTDLLQKDIQRWPQVQLMMTNASTFYGCLY